jgi:hypothetical protein
MNFFRQYSIIIGVLALILVIILLVLVPSTILAPQATFIGTDLQRASQGETQVRTRMDFGDIEHLQTFPKNFGSWIGLDFDPSDMAEALGADFLVLRTYLNTTYYQPVHFVIMQSQEPSSFHPPPVCYKAANWKIEEEAVEAITVEDINWAGTTGTVSINVKKMVVSRESVEGDKEREIVLYYYVKGKLFENKVTMIEASASIPAEGPYEGILVAVKDFLGETVPYMFEHVAVEKEILAVHLARSWGGWVIMVILILIPLAIIIYPRIRRR